MLITRWWGARIKSRLMLVFKESPSMAEESINVGIFIVESDKIGS